MSKTLPPTHTNTTLGQLIQLLITASLFITPFIVLPWTSELFEFPKMIFLYALTTIILLLWFLHLPLYKYLPFQRTPLDLPILIFLITMIVSTTYSIDPHTSIWGYYSRFHGGLGSIIAYIIIFYASLTFLTPHRLGTNNIIIANATLLSIYAIAQHFGIDAHIWKQDVQNRVFSTLGQPNWLAAYLVAIIPLLWIKNSTATSVTKHLPLLTTIITGLLIYSATTTKFLLPHANLTLSGQILYELIFLTIIFLTLSILNYKKNVSSIYYTALIYLALLYTRSRSGFIAFIISYLIFWTIHLYKSSPKLTTLSRLAQFTLPLILISLITATPYTPSILSTTTATSQLPPPPNHITDSGDIRKIVWQGAWELGKKYPLLGTGPETFAYSYYFTRPPEHNLVSEWDFLYNKAHNEYLNYWATTGIIGTLSYLTLLTTTYIILLLTIKKQPLSSTQTLSLTAYLAGYTSILITNFFGFSVVTVSLLFWIYPALGLILLLPPPNKLHFSRPITYTIIPLSILTCIYLFTKVFNIFQSDIYYGYAQKMYNQNQNEKSLTLINQAITQNPSEPQFYNFASKVSADLSIQSFHQKDATQAAQLANLSHTYSTIATQKSPYNSSFWKNKSATLISLSTLDPQLTTIAIQDLETAQKLAPTDPKITYNLALLYARQKNYPRAIEILDHTISLKPNYDLAYFARASYHRLNSLNSENQIQNPEQFQKAIQDLQVYITLTAPDDRNQELLQSWQTQYQALTN